MKTEYAPSSTPAARLTELNAREQDLLLMHVSGRSRSYLYSHPEFKLSAQQQTELLALQRRCLEGEPLAYVLGQQPFRNLLLKVNPAVLIPRPETEELVEQALAKLRSLGARAPANTLTVLDLGTGSGAIALAIGNEHPNCSILATDNSAQALAISKENQQANSVATGSRVSFQLSDWYQSVTGAFDLVLANPPYVAQDDPHLETSVKSHEPRAAVIAQEAGFADLRHIIRMAPPHLKPGAWLILEHGWQQGQEVRKLLLETGFKHVETKTDLAGHERITLGRLGTSPGAKNHRE